MLRFQKRYFIITILLFVVEIFIAVFIYDQFVHPYVGDYLVVILIYCFLRSFILAPVWIVALSCSFFRMCLKHYNILTW